MSEKESKGVKVVKKTYPKKEVKRVDKPELCVKEDSDMKVSVLMKENALLAEKVAELKESIHDLESLDAKHREEKAALRKENETLRQELLAEKNKAIEFGMLLDDREFEIEELGNRGFWARVFNKGVRK